LEVVQAIIYLKEEGNDAHKITLSDQRLIVVKSNKSHKFTRDEVKKLEINHRILLLPIIGGGIIASLSLLAIFEAYQSVFFLLTIFMTSLLLFYYGWQGELVVTIITRIKDFDFKIAGKTDNLEAFINFTNNQISDQSSSWSETKYFYFVVPENKAGLEQILLTAAENIPFKLIEYGQLASATAACKKPCQLIKLDPMLLRVEIKYKRDISDNKLYPYIYGPINKEAVILIESLA